MSSTDVAAPRPFVLGCLTEANREQIAHLYATTQLESLVMKSLNATYDDLYTYALHLYDVCTRPPCISVALFDAETRELGGCVMVCRADDFDSLDETKLAGKAGAHAALCKSFQEKVKELVVKREKNPDKLPLIYTPFGCVSKKFQGQGAMTALSEELRARQLATGDLWGWAFTFKHGLFAADRAEGRDSTLKYSYAVSPLHVFDVKDFDYQGVQPFGDSLEAHLAVYKLNRGRKVPRGKL
eukprot:TRINITY_DN10034_c0_g1_i1.p2 TRINITY_DN10034_c0_g1~~TRINITY_DN10034_c0_g1_i1.p2  ORF type:complete len:241 (+),score=86.91 TRINITY_DN10034_c0_g1_i1:311-1033(+)